MLATAASAQRFTVGAKGAIPINEPTPYNSGANPYAIGPAVGFRLFRGLSLESGLLIGQYGKRRISLLAVEGGPRSVSFTERTRTFDVPVLARYEPRIGGRNWKLFVSAGVAMRRANVKVDTPPLLFPLASSIPASSSRVTWSAGPTAGLGIDVKMGRVHLEPEFRYSYWGARSYRTSLRPNQGSFLLGFRF